MEPPHRHRCDLLVLTSHRLSVHHLNRQSASLQADSASSIESFQDGLSVPAQDFSGQRILSRFAPFFCPVFETPIKQCLALLLIRSFVMKPSCCTRPQLAFLICIHMIVLISILIRVSRCSWVRARASFSRPANVSLES